MKVFAKFLQKVRTLTLKRLLLVARMRLFNKAYKINILYLFFFISFCIYFLGHFHEFKGDLPVTSGCWGDPRV